MKKLFLFIVALLTSLMVGATSYVVDATASANDNIRRVIDHGHSIQVADGDTLYLQDATYIEGSTELTFTNNLVILPLEGAKPTIQLTIPMKIMGAGLTVKGVKFTNSYVRVYSGASGSVVFDGCSFEDMSDYAILMDKADVQLEALTFNNCLFKNVTKNAINVYEKGNTAPGVTKALTVTNSTFINCSNAGDTYTIFAKDHDENDATPGPECLIDHCTFYDCSHKENSTFMVYLYHIVEATISNCVASHSENQPNTESFTAYQLKEADVVTKASVANNCIYYNCKGANWQMTKTNVTNADPLFVGPANGNFNFAFTSPLFLAATDGTHIGDPRWGVEEPETAIEVPGTLPVMDAVLQGTKISKSEEGIKWNDNSANPDDNTASWVIDVAKAGTYEVVINSATTATAHKYRVCLANVNAWLDVKAEPERLWKEGDFSIGTFTIPEAGTYMIRMMNEQVNSSTEVKSLTMNYAGGSVVNLPGTLPNEDAILGGNDKVNVDEEGYICFSEDGNVPNCYAKWNANFTKKGKFEVSLSVATTNGHQLAIQVLDGENVISETTQKWLSENGNLVLGIISVPQPGNYTIKFINTLSSSAARVKDITLTYAGGGVVTVPETLLPADAMLSEKAFIDKDTIIFAPRGAEGYTPEGWAKWNVRLENDAICAFTANCHRFSGNSMNIKISVINTENDTIYQKEENVENSGNSEVALGNILLTAGDYVIQMQNTVQHSKGRLMSVVVGGSQILVITDDSNIDFSNYANQTVNVQLQRTFKANMYNPICLPFGVDHSVLQSILKCETTYLLKSSSLEGQKLYVELEASQYNDIYHGSPYMIKPSADVVNPLFTNVKIMGTPQASSSTKGVLKLQGSFASHIIDNPQSSLLVGANNTLFFPNDETPYIKSMRAYFILQDIQPSQMPKFACFREPGNAPTWMPIVGAETEKPNGKFIRDGRFVIVREGKEYNAQGVEL